MEQLLSLLKTIPEYKTMLSALQNGQSVAIMGIGQINRSHMIAGLHQEANRPWYCCVRMKWLPDGFRRN